ncbi:MAG: hypothetical protein JWM80_4229 [Cyanobacteria bacterium RYN_339]|nr:hypothetical protein [Cyanobacteria bacterium RYN_339]
MSPRTICALVALLLAACVPLGTAPVATPATPTPAPTLAFATGTLQLQTGETKSLAQLLTLSGQPIDAVTLGLLAFQVGDASLASVGADGSLKGLKAGSTTVIAVNKLQPTLRAQLTLNVVANGGAVQIQIKPETAVLGIGETMSLTAEVHLASGVVNANVDWSSSDDTIATVNRTTGLVSGVKEGRVTIRAAYSQDTSFQQVADVRVVKDKTQAVPSAAPSVVVFGGAPSPSPGAAGPTPTPAPLGAWTRQATGVKDALTAVRFLDAKTGFAMGAGGVLLKTTDGTAWASSYPVSLGFQTVTDFDFGSAGTGIAIINGKAYRTTDGGGEWTALTTPAGTVRRARFASATSVDLLADANLFHSADGGASWTKVDVPAPGATAFARRGDKLWVGQGAKLLRPVADIGWANVQTSVSTIADLKFVSDDVGFVTGEGAARVVAVTLDGGKTVSAPIATANVALDWADAQHGLTINTGRGSYNANNQVVFDTMIAGTTDGGLTWGNTTLPTLDGGLAAIAYPTATTAWAVGANGQIYRFEATR